MKHTSLRRVIRSHSARRKDKFKPDFEHLESRHFMHGEGVALSDVEELPIFNVSPYYTMQDQITSGIVGDVAGSGRTYKVRIGDDAHRSEMFIVGDTTATRQTTTDVIVRRMVGDSPANMQVSVTLVDGNPAWWSASLAETTFQLGRAPTTSTGDVDDPGEIGRIVGDGDIDNDDLAAFETYYTGAGVPLAANKALIGINFDFDGDLDVDDDDRAVLQSHFTGPVTTPWNKKIDLTITASLDAPEDAMGRFQIVVTNLDTGEVATTFAYGIKAASAPLLELRERLDFTIETDEKLAFSRIVNFDLKLDSLGADTDTLEIFADPIPGFGLNVLNIFGAKTSQITFQPQTIPQFITLQVVTPLIWAAGSEQTIMLRARSTITGEESVLPLTVSKAGDLYTEDDLLRSTGRRHDVSPSGVTTYGFTITNSTIVARTYTLAATPSGAAPGWTTQFSSNNFTLAPLEQRFVTMTVRAPANAPLNANYQWQVKLNEGTILRGTAQVGTRVTTTPPKVIFVAVDGLSREYLDMNAAGTGPGGPGNWLMPNVRAYMQRATTFSNANSVAPHATDPNHIAALTGSLPGTNGASSVNIFYGGQDPDGAPLEEFSETLGADLLRYGPNGEPVLSMFDIAKQQNPNTSNAFLTSKGWMQYYFNEEYGGAADVIVEGREMPAYVERPPVHFLGDPPSDTNPSDPASDASIGNWGYLAGFTPSDRWIMDNALKVLDIKDPGMMYILLGGVDESSHSFGGAGHLEEWDTKGTATTLDDVSLINPRANREDNLDIVREVDVLFGQLIAKLNSRGILDSTYIVLLADHNIVNHEPQFLDVADLLESEGYAHITDYQLLTRSSGGLIFDTAPGETANIEQILETAPSIAPGLSANPWVIMNRAEMLTGIDTATGRVMGAPGELYSEYYAEQTTGDVKWPELIILMDDNWALEYRQFFGGEDKLLRAEYVGGHSGPATEPIPLIIGGPNIPFGQVISNSVEIVDIAPTLYALLGWQAPANVEGSLLPGINVPSQSLALTSGPTSLDIIRALVSIDPQTLISLGVSTNAAESNISNVVSALVQLASGPTPRAALEAFFLEADLQLQSSDLDQLASNITASAQSSSARSIDLFWQLISEDVDLSDAVFVGLE